MVNLIDATSTRQERPQLSGPRRVRTEMACAPAPPTEVAGAKSVEQRDAMNEIPPPASDPYLQLLGIHRPHTQSPPAARSKVQGSRDSISLPQGFSRPSPRRRHQCRADRRSGAVINQQRTAINPTPTASHLKSFIRAISPTRRPLANVLPLPSNRVKYRV